MGVLGRRDVRVEWDWVDEAVRKEEESRASWREGEELAAK